MTKDNEYRLHEILGGAEYFAASVAAKFPDLFAQTVATWNPDDLDAIIEALEERRKING